MPISKSEAKEKIKKLIERYEQVKKSHQTKTYDEANTRKDFIMPLFQILGWDIHNELIKREVVEEATVVKGRVDYSFRINNIPQFLLEAKALKINLEKPEWAEQAVNYGWNKGIPWVVLSNFEKLKLFNSDWKVDKPKPNLEFSYQDYIERFDHLWLLSKEASKTKELDKLLSQFGITAKRINVNEKLAEDLVNWRNNLTDNLSKWNTGYSTSEIEEAVQRILDRLIFVRVVEDREIEDKILWQAFQKWEADKYQPYNFIKALVPIFRGFDKKYNSNLFLPHPCEKLDTEGEPFQKIVPELYGNREAGVKYRFDAIGADVLGSVYEQYLGHVQRREGDKSKRKKQGIYYTPTYIVDYIVQQTLGEALKEKTLMEIENIKVLDPACGSGSFLIKGFNVLDQKIAKLRVQKSSGPKAAFRKYNILRNNIYGVDLDPQAIEIARLNLLLRALEPNNKLPLLDNTKVGNSLISGEEKQLKKYFGKDYQDKNPFNWDKEFKEVFDQGGFDVIVGNPPYVSYYSRFSQKSPEVEPFLEYLRKTFRFPKYRRTSGRLNTVMFFIERGISLLKNGGRLGFIVDVNIFKKASRDIRRYILATCCIEKIAPDLVSFSEVVSGQVILVLRKEQDEEKRLRNKVAWIHDINDPSEISFIAQRDWADNKEHKFAFSPHLTLLSKIDGDTDTLGEVANVVTGVQIGGTETFKGRPVKEWFRLTQRKDENSIKRVDLKKLDRYSPIYYDGFINFDLTLASEATTQLERSAIVLKKYLPFIEGKKLLVRQSSPKIVATHSSEANCAEYSAFSVESDKVDPLFLLALLNSKLLTFYAQQKGIIEGRKGTQPQIRKEGLERLPIKKTSENSISKLSNLAGKMLKLNKDLQECAEDSDKFRGIKTEIEKVDKQIDQIVYELYNLTLEETRIVEEG